MAISRVKQELKHYPIAYNPVIEYYNQIESGEILVSKKVERVYKELVRKINDPECKYEYSSMKANHALEFIENFCKKSKVKRGEDTRLILELWQKAMVAATFGFVDKETQLRMIRELVLIISRKHGKSTVGSAMALYLLIADGEAGAEVYAVSTKKDAAKIVWSESVKMIKKSPSLSKRLKALVSEIRFDTTESTYKPLSSDSNSLDGLNVHASFMDELHAWKDKNLYDVIVDGMTARDQPLNIIMTTAGTVREGIYDIKYAECERIINGYDDKLYEDDRVLPIIYELDSAEEIHDMNMWVKANPALNTFKSREELERKYKKALDNSTNMPNLLCKDFNIRQNGVNAWLSFEEAENKATFSWEELKPKYAVGGIDLAKGIDLTSACVGFMLPDSNTVYYEHMYWMLADTIEQREQEDKVPYQTWVDKGYIRLCEGTMIDYKEITRWFLEIQQKYNCYIYMVGYDSYNASYLVDDIGDHFGKHSVKSVPQIPKVLSIPMTELGAKLKAKEVNYNDNPVTKWCLMNTTVKTDTNGNIQPHKGLDRTRRIDGLAAMLDSFVIMSDNRQEYYGAIGKYQ
ncbi:terminase large subunit [Lysinibacillus sp. fkY74-1]